MPWLLPTFGEATCAAKKIVFLACVPAKGEKALTLPHKLVRPEVDGGDLCKADGSELHAAIACSQTPQLPPSFHEASHTVKTFFCLAASLPRVKKLNPF